jgi:hypothetical protein
VVEELDDRGGAKSRREKEYDVTLLGGIPYLRLVKLDGRALPPTELRAEEDRDRKLREQADVNRPAGKKGDGTGYFTPGMAARFQFRVEREEWVGDRRCWVLSFRSKPDQPSSKLSERVINKLGGRFWVDQLEAEVVRVEADLSERIALWGGFIGTLDVFRMSLQRARGEDGMWYNELGTLRVEGRKLLTPIRFSANEESGNFKRAEPVPPSKSTGTATGGR